MKYGIKVPISFDNHGEYTDWLWIVDSDLKPRLFETLEKAQKEIVYWGPSAIIEEYGENNTNR